MPSSFIERVKKINAEIQSQVRATEKKRKEKKLSNLGDFIPRC